MNCRSKRSAMSALRLAWPFSTVLSACRDTPILAATSVMLRPLGATISLKSQRQAWTEIEVCILRAMIILQVHIRHTVRWVTVHSTHLTTNTFTFYARTAAAKVSFLGFRKRTRLYPRQRSSPGMGASPPGLDMISSKRLRLPFAARATK
jgi:hypothetical protein